MLLAVIGIWILCGVGAVVISKLALNEQITRAEAIAILVIAPVALASTLANWLETIDWWDKPL